MSGKPRLVLAGLALLAGIGPDATSAAETSRGNDAVYKLTDSERVFADAPSNLTVQLCGCNSACGDDCGCGSGECGEACGGGCCSGALGDPWTLDSNDDDITFGGWWQQGYTSASTGMFNNIPNRFNTHQAWFYAEKVADGSKGMDWGFRADIMYGTDASKTQAFGNNPGRWDYLNGWDFGQYGWALPQLYAEVAVGDLSVKAGHFYTLLGYEVVTAPDNFFFSHSMTMFNSEAFTHTGVLGTYAASDDVTLYGGWTLGWDTGFDQFGNGNNFLGGFSVPFGDNATFTYITTIGDMGVRGNGYSHSTVLDISVTDKFNYVLQSDLVQFKTGGGMNNEVGINNFLLYSFTDKLGLGARVEWWKSDAGFNHGGNSLPSGGSVSYYAATFGANIKPHSNVIIRPEYRYDWAPGAGSYTQGIFAVDMILTY